MYAWKKNSEQADKVSVVSTEMDFSLLASEMQKFLTITSSEATQNASERRVGAVSHGYSTGTPGGEFRRPRAHISSYLEDIEVLRCPLCPSTFNAKDLLAKHALRIHHKAVVTLLQGGSTEQHLKCRFCVHKVMQRHHKLLLLHLEKKHSTEFISFLRQSFLPTSVPSGANNKGICQPVADLQTNLESISLSRSVKPTECCISTDQASTLKYCDESNINSLTKPKTFFDNFLDKPKAIRTSDFPPQISNHSLAKRKLFLDGSVRTRSCAGSPMKENIPPGDSLHATLAASRWKHASGKHFSCGRCKEAFSCNALLLDHVSIRHRGPLRLLQPLFKCGLCSASFYKNSFLVRHCYRHHSPK